MFGPLLEVARLKKCTPLWREARFEVNICETLQLRSTFKSCDVDKVHDVVSRSTFRSQNVQNTMLGPLLEVAMSKKCTRLWREAHFEVKMLKAPGVRTTFGRSDVVSRGRRKGCISKNDGRRGACAEDLARCIFRGRRSTRDMFIVPRSGR